MPSVLNHKTMLWTLLVVMAGMLAGCKSETSTPVVPPDQAVDNLQNVYQQQLPNAPIGRVVDVLPDARLAAVTNLSHQDQLKDGDRVTFVDVNQQIVAHGHVLDPKPDAEYVNVHYDEEGGRAPRKGDLMIKVSSGM